MSGELKDLFMKYFPDINICILLVNNFKIGSFFRYKDILPSHMRPSLVCKFCCARCASAYVGMTARNFYARVGEHRGRSYRTGHSLPHPPHSALRTHAEQCNVLVPDTDLKVLAYSSGASDLRILESLYIFKREAQFKCCL
jgi:hypothetical protein